MFERLVESILVEYFSEWVDGLDSEKMKVALFGGKVELCELKLKTSSLDKFQLPLTVKAGTIGRLTMKVPWKRLTKEAVTIRVEDLYLLVVPAHEEELQRQKKKKSAKTAATGSKDEKDEEDSYALRIRWAKQQEVRVRELLEKNMTEDVPSGDNSGGDTTASWGYREKILHNIMDNVSFEFAKIHIRYEDTTQLLTKNPLALGITIDSITVSTTNANGHVTFVDRSQSHTPFVHKIMEMNLAGFYCDDTSKVQDLISTRRREPLASSYIIHPFNTSIKMTVNHDETTAFSIPKFQFVGDISSINAFVTPDQCNDLISVINYVSTHELYLKRIHCRRRRPTVPVKRNAKKWWQYAFFGVQVMYSLSSRKASSSSSGSASSALTRYGKSKPPCDWKLFGVLWKSQKEYIRLHKRLLRAAGKKSPIEGVVAERCRLNELEDILDVDSIVFFRVCATQELELEETRNDSVKKLSNWKARWNSRSQSQESEGLRSLDPFEKQVLYRTISEQMHASSIALAAKELESKNSQTILFAVDVAISSIRISLIEHHVYDSTSTTGSTREFLQFELQQFVFAIFQRNVSSSISSSIKSIQMVDFSQVGDPVTGERLSQPLFYSLASSSPVLGAASKAKANGETAKALPVPMSQHFLDLKIESSETKFKLDCSFEPFRYIHNLSVAAKLQTYFVAQVDVSPALIENAEDALAYSSEWLNNAVFAGPSAPSASSGGSGKQGQAASSVAPARTVEFSIRLPEVDVLVLTTDTSPILQARSINLEFKSGNLLDTFAFAVEGVTILFYDGVNAHGLEVIEDSTSGSHEPKLLHHQDGLKDVRKAPSQAAMKVKQSDYDLTHRKYSTILRKTRLVFHGEKITAQNRPPKWLMKCTAPPIYFTLSSAQYRQVLQASASWGNSETEDDGACSPSALKSVSKETIDPGEEPSKKPHRSTSSFIIKEFDDEDERFGLCIMIPQILIVLEGEDAASGDAIGSDKPSGAAVSEDLAIVLVLDIKEVNVEAKFSSSAQAAAVDILSLAVFKRVKDISKDGKKEKVSTAEAMAKVNEDIAKSSVSEPQTECEQSSEPDPVYDPTTGAPTCKLLEVGPKASFVLCSTDPFKGKIKTQRVVLYWDQDLLVALFRSYLLGNSSIRSCSATSSRSSSRSSSGPSRSEATDDKLESSKPPDAKAAGADSKAAAVQINPPGPFGLELQIERWYIYCRPHCTKSSNFTLKLCGKGLFGDITTLKTPYVVVKLHVKGGVVLESSRLVLESDRAPSSENEIAPDTSEDVCQLLSVSEPLTVIVESAGYGVLTHRTGAATYVNIHASDIELNYVSSHFGVFRDYLQNQLISFFNWVSVQTLPAGVIPLDERTKIDADLTKIRLLLPRGAVGNPFMRQRKPERMEMDIKQVLVKSRRHPDCPRMEQLRIQVDNVHISTCMIDSGLRAHTDAIGSVDEAVASAKAKATRLALEQQIAASKTKMFSHKAVFIEYAALPIVEDEKKKKRRKRKEAEEDSVPRKKGFKDIEDVVREMEKLCGFVKVTLHRPLDWDTDAKQNGATIATRGEPLTGSALINEKRKDMRIETNQEIDLALDLQQLELFGGILNENFAECEILPRARSVAATEDEYMSMDVQVLIGDVSLTMLCSNSIADYQEKKALSPEERAIALVQLKNVKVLINVYSSQRAQYRVVSSKASLWNVDLVSKQVSSEESSASATREKILTSCAEMYSSSDAGALDQCIDITIDHHEPPADSNATPLPQDIRVHVETCALTLGIIHFASRVEPFLFCKSQLQFYTPPPSNPSNVSVTTGTVHCMLAKYYPGASGPSSSHDTPTAIAQDAEDGDIALHLILSGCFVVRYSDSDASLQHVQLFGRKMSFEITAQWPPESDTSLSTEVPPSPSPSPTCSLISPSLRRVSTASRDISSEDLLLSLADYRRVLCDDFAIDMDMIDTLKSDGVMKISASLTHFHAVLCVFDMMMISQIANFDFEDKNSRESAVADRERADAEVDPVIKPTADAISVSSKSILKTEIIVNMILEDASVTFVREIGEYFIPVARLYTFCAMCKIRLETPSKSASPPPHESPALPATHLPSNVVEIALHFSEDNESELRDDDGMSVWGFNTLLGSWEPVIEPWTFALAVTLVNDRAGKVITSIDLRGSDVHSLSVNLSPSLLDSFCAITKEMEQLVSDPRSIQVSSASVISCGFYLANDCGVEISYWVSDNGAASHTSRGFSYAPRQKRVPELLLPRHKVPLKLSTAIFHSLPADQTVSFSWGDEDWHPLTDVRIHSAGKYVYSVLPRSKAPAIVSSSAKPAPSSSKSSPAEPPALLALFDISSVFGYRTLTVSSLVRVFNDTDIAIDCGILAEDGKSITEIGTIEAHGACGIPITLVKAIASVRVLVKPHKYSSASSSAVGSSDKSAGTVAINAADMKDHRWSNELFISEKEDCTEHFASCSLILDDFDCKCQRMFDGSQPLHVSQICRANGSFLRVWNRMFTASNASSLRYSQMRVLPPLTFENKCGVALFVVVFVFKKVRRAGAQDREYFHLVASEKIPPRSNMQFLASSLHESTYCSVSMTGFSWSKLFLLPTVFPNSASADMFSSSNDVRSGGAGGNASPSSVAGLSSTPSLPSSPANSSTNGSEVLCTLSDFRARQATINVAFVSASQELNAMRKVIIQPRFVVHNDTPLPLLFEPRAKARSKMSNAKAFFSLTSAIKKQAATCCGSPQLELIHSKLNALNGATTTPASPTARSTVFKGSQGSGSSAGPSSSHAISSASIQEEMEFFYCSESNFLNIQLEGNTIPNSGVQQFRLDAAMGGVNSSLRLFDEGKKLWYDLVAILEQIDSFTTKVTFVERYLILNRTHHEILCMPACDIVPSSHHGQEHKQTPASPNATVTATAAAVAETNVMLRPSATTSFNWCLRPTIPSDSCIRLKIQGGGSGGDKNVAGWRWSGRFSLHEVSETALKMSNKYTNQVHVLRVEIRVESSVRVYVVLTSEDTAPFPLYRIINSSASEMIHFKQGFEGGSGELSEHSALAGAYNRGVTQRLLSGENICFGWDEAYFLQSLERLLVVSYASNAAHSKILLDQPGEAQRVEIPASKTKPATQVYVHWYLNGVTKTIHVHDTELPRDKLTGKQNAPPVSDRTESSSSVIQRAATLVSELNLNLTLPSVLLSVLNSKPEEVLLFSAEKLELAYAKTVNEHDQCEVKIGSFQLDNQLENAVFPVIFTPVPSNSFIDSPRKQSRPMTPPTLQERKRSNAGGERAEEEDDDERFLHMSIFRLSYGDDVEYIKYFSAMLQPARLQIDDFLIVSVASLFTDCMQVVLRHYPQNNAEVEHRVGSDASSLQRGSSAVNDGMVRVANASSGDASIAKIPPIERRMYIETLQLHPMKIHITFQQNNLSKATFFDDQATILLPMVFMILKSNLVNIDCASLNLNALHIYHSFTTRAFMFSTIQQHYVFQGILQIYALVGAADILGNPIGLVTNLGTGVKDFFYEPVAGMVKSPQEFVLGLSRGTASLVKNSVYGTFNAASKFTGTLSSGVAALSMDSKYIKERNTRNRQEVPTHFGTGLLYGTKQLGQGILAGVSGVITAPAMGAYNNGLTGFVEGMGRGLIGVAIKPAAGVLDLAARTTAGITATATVFDRKARNTRIRLPRMMHTSDKRLRVYSGDEAMISQLLHKLPQRLLQNEHYEAHVFLPQSRAVIATSHQFLHVDFSSIAAAAMGPSPPRITWKCPLTNLWGAQKTSRGVSIMIGTATNVQVSPHMTTLVTKSSMSTVLIPLRDTETLFADRVVKCVAELVARQRERATPTTETYAAPPPRNSIGLVLEPVRKGAQVQGYDGSGGQVVDVFVGSACFRAGVEVGDVIVGFCGKKLERGDHGSALRYQLSLMKKGDTLELMILRNGETKTIKVAAE
ncbi:hypothetical protein Gpo141_00010363 [Globisporangium polare]